MKMFAFFDGAETVFSVYEQFDVGTNGIDVGDSLTFNAYVITENPDKIGVDNEAYIAIKFFDGGFAELGNSPSTALTNADDAGVWTPLAVTATVPAGAVFAQAVFEYKDCIGSVAACDDTGSVYFDNAFFYVD